MRFYSRLAAIEKAVRHHRGPLPMRHFVTVDSGQSYVENTPRRGHFDYRGALLGSAGDVPAELPRFTSADLAGIERDGFQVIVIEYGPMETVL